MITCFCLLLLFINFSTQDITPDVKISVEVPPKDYLRSYSNGTVNMYVKRGSNMLLECVIFNMPIKGNVYWRKYPYKGNSGSIVTINKGLTSYDLSKFKIGQGNEPDSIRLEILSVDESYGGIYACEVAYSANVVNAKAERTLMLYDLPQITYTEFKNKVDSGKDITLTCTATGIPPPSVLWKRIGGMSNIIKNTGVVLYDNKVTLTKVSYLDAGMYACYAENEWGSEERKFSLSVSHAPVISITPNGNDAYQKLGCMVQLICAVKADPSPLPSQITWDSSVIGKITTGGRFTVKLLPSSDQEMFYILRIYPTLSQDLDKVKYTCSATNLLGSNSESVVFQASPDSNPLLTGPYPCRAIGLGFSLFIPLATVLMILVIRKSL